MARSVSFKDSVSVGVEINKSRWFIIDHKHHLANVPCYFRVKAGPNGYWDRRERKDFKDVIAHYN